MKTFGKIKRYGIQHNVQQTQYINITSNSFRKLIVYDPFQSLVYELSTQTGINYMRGIIGYIRKDFIVKTTGNTSYAKDFYFSIYKDLRMNLIVFNKFRLVIRIINVNLIDAVHKTKLSYICVYYLENYNNI